jgi:hypothetical protein
VIGIALILPAPAASVPPSSPHPVPGNQLQPVETGLGEGTAVVAIGAPSKTQAGEGVESPAPVTAVIPEPTATRKPRSTVVLSSATVRAATMARVTASQRSGTRVRLTTAIVLRFDRPVTLRAVRAAFTITPAVKGTIRATGNKLFTFTPATPLAANTGYTVTLRKVIKDTDGVAVVSPGAVRLLTAAPPALVRFRPTKGTSEVDPTALVSVRFTKPMNKSTTANAFAVVVAGKKLNGTITWAEGDTVLVFKPATVLAKGAGVGVRILGTATSADGVPIKKGGSATFKVVPAPAPAPAPKPTAAKAAAKPVVKPVVRPVPPRKPGSGGGSLGGGSWAAAEAYYLRLMNCTRTGGFVTSSGGCASPGGRQVAPLKIDQGISARVSRPYARYLATTGICSHFADGNPGVRLKRAGYHSYKWAENISCPKSMDVMGLMVYTQQYFQAERSYNGGHYVNLMNPLYDRVGIGVWVANGRAEVVIDFYRP